MPGYLDDLLRMLDQAQAPQGVTRAMAPPGMSGMDMEGEALRQALAGQPVLGRNGLPMDNLQAAFVPDADFVPDANFIPNQMTAEFGETMSLMPIAQDRAAEYAAIKRHMESRPYSPDGGQFEEPFRVIPDFTFPKDPRYTQVLAPYPSQPPMQPVPVTRDNPMAYGNNMQMPAPEMEPANMEIRSLLAALAGAGGGFAAGRMTAPQHTMPDGTVMPGSEEEMYGATAASMPQELEDLTNGGQRVPGSMRMPMPPPYKTPPQLQRLNNLRMP